MDEVPIGIGAIVGIVIAALICCVCCIGLVALLVMRSNGSKAKESRIAVHNTAFETGASMNPDFVSARGYEESGRYQQSSNYPTAATNGFGLNDYPSTGTVGVFTCNICQKSYNYADDLAEHVSLRHP